MRDFAVMSLALVLNELEEAVRRLGKSGQAGAKQCHCHLQ
jgi:hypothetical protein